MKVELIAVVLIMVALWVAYWVLSHSFLIVPVLPIIGVLGSAMCLLGVFLIIRRLAKKL